MAKKQDDDGPQGIRWKKNHNGVWEFPMLDQSRHPNRVERRIRQHERETAGGALGYG